MSGSFTEKDYFGVELIYVDFGGRKEGLGDGVRSRVNLPVPVSNPDTPTGPRSSKVT